VLLTASVTCKQHNSTCPGVQVFLISVIRSEGRAKGGKCLGRHFPEGGISRKIKIIRPVYGHLNALNARYPSIRGVLWRLKWTLKCTKFIFGRSSTHMHTGELPTLVSWDLGQGGAAGWKFAPGTIDLRAATVSCCMWIMLQLPQTAAISDSALRSVRKERLSLTNEEKTWIKGRF